MRQVKLFKHVESELVDLQTQTNEWLAEIQQQGATVIRVTGNIAPQTPNGASSGSTRFPPSDILVVIEYDTAS